MASYLSGLTNRYEDRITIVGLLTTNTQPYFVLPRDKNISSWSCVPKFSTLTMKSATLNQCVIYTVEDIISISVKKCLNKRVHYLPMCCNVIHLDTKYRKWWQLNHYYIVAIVIKLIRNHTDNLQGSYSNWYTDWRAR